MAHPLTLRWFARLPDAWRGFDDDEHALGLMAGIGDELGEVQDLVDGVDRRYIGDLGFDPLEPETSTLVDPETAPPEWLAWVAQLYGVNLDASAPESFADSYGQLSIDYPTYAALTAAHATYADLAEATTPVDVGLTVAEQRATIAARAGWRAGSWGAIRALIQSELVGTKTVKITRHDGHWARVRLSTYETETPQPWRVERLLARADVAPATVELVHELILGATYGELTAEFATHAALDAAFVTYDDMIHHIP